MTLEEARQKIQVNGIYKHYKGGTYQVDLIATDTENDEPMVVYHLYGTDFYYVRPARIRLEHISKPRFTLLGE